MRAVMSSGAFINLYIYFSNFNLKKKVNFNQFYLTFSFDYEERFARIIETPNSASGAEICSVPLGSTTKL